MAQPPASALDFSAGPFSLQAVGAIWSVAYEYVQAIALSPRFPDDCNDPNKGEPPVPRVEDKRKWTGCALRALPDRCRFSAIQ